MTPKMHLVVLLFGLLQLLAPISAQRRTAPRRSTTPKGWTPGPSTEAPETTTSNEVATSPTTPKAAPVRPSAVSVVAPVAVPGAIPVAVVPGLPSAGAIIASAPRRLIPEAAVTSAPVPTTTPDKEFEEPEHDAAMDAKGPKVFGASLCEEVEELIQPGAVEQECFTGELVKLRFWQPWKALRNIRCKSTGNDTSSVDTQRCARAYPGAQCVQKYQQFVVLAAMGPAASGWACIRLGSGCSCSVRSPGRLRKTDFEQRSDLREFLRES